MADINSIKETRQERRERRLRKRRGKMPQHGHSLARVYKDAVLKRLKPPGTPERDKNEQKSQQNE